MKKFLIAALQAAKIGGRIQASHYQKPFEVKQKEGWANLVTEIDFKCQKAIIKSIKTKFPRHDVLAEEEGAERCSSEYRWIIDPIDGTTNFSRGFPFFCVSIALEINGEIQVGVIYEPLRKEAFTAMKGKGAFLNGKRIRVDSSNLLERSISATGFSYKKEMVEKNLVYFDAAARRFQAMRRTGSAALDLAYISCGRTHAYWDLSLQPWDVAAGLLIVTEAGGRVTNMVGKPYSVDQPDILASNGFLHEQILTLFQPISAKLYR